MDWKNYYHSKCLYYSNWLLIQRNSCQNSNGIFHTNRKKIIKFIANSKWIKTLNIRCKTISILKQTGRKLLEVGLGNDFFKYNVKSTGNKSRNKWVRLYQTQKLLHSKGKKSWVKKQPMGEIALYEFFGNIFRGWW